MRSTIIFIVRLKVMTKSETMIDLLFATTIYYYYYVRCSGWWMDGLALLHAFVERSSC